VAKGAAAEKLDQPQIEALEAKNKALEAELDALRIKVVAGEEAALARVSKALGVDAEGVKLREAANAAKAPEEEVKMFVQTPVRINGRVYHGHVQCALSVARVLHQAVGDRRQRIMNELTHNKYQLRELMGGGYAPVLVSSQIVAPGETL
jgi:hypothetical protein